MAIPKLIPCLFTADSDSKNTPHTLLSLLDLLDRHSGTLGTPIHSTLCQSTQTRPPRGAERHTVSHAGSEDSRPHFTHKSSQ